MYRYNCVVSIQNIVLTLYYLNRIVNKNANDVVKITEREVYNEK